MTVYTFDWRSTTEEPQCGFVEVRALDAIAAMLRARREVRARKLQGLDLARIVLEQTAERPDDA
jgi:hypothetical protein